MKYLLNKTDHRVVPWSEDAAKSGGSDWTVIDEAEAAAIMDDKTGRVVAEFFQKRQLEEANRLLAIAKGDVPAPAPAAPAAPADPMAAMAAVYAAYAGGRSAPLSPAEREQGVRDAGATAVQSSATPEQIAALPAPPPPEPATPPSEPATPPSEPATPPPSEPAKTAKAAAAWGGKKG